MDNETARESEIKDEPLRETRLITPSKERDFTFAVFPHKGEYGLFKIYKDKDGIEIERELKMIHHKKGINHAFDINEQAFFPAIKKVDSVAE